MNAPPTPRYGLGFLLLLAALFCFLIAFLIAIGTFGGNTEAWAFGGSLTFVASFLPFWP